MQRKKRQENESAETESAGAGAVTPQPLAVSPAIESVTPPTDEHISGDQSEEKNWGPPYTPYFISKAKGFEMGENRRFKQRVFLFKEKPDERILAALKENGFTYRPNEKAWTIHADTASRLLSERLAHEFDGPSESMSR